MPAVNRSTTSPSSRRHVPLPSAHDVCCAKKLRAIEKKRGRSFPEGLPLRFQMGRLLMIRAADEIIAMEPFLMALESFNAKLNKAAATRVTAEEALTGAQEAPSDAPEAPTDAQGPQKNDSRSANVGEEQVDINK